ncbi:sterol desaturase family protein [Sphingomicrobium lutaoense]|uniref:Sterol desaturase/sphingolipid hydroxylase (Fatty acid hydroxylase superfamily) n=1 Tax=Sphingomicrobium lutaoense TaxID=515949 RepID=A0A839YVY6_9SPHN|nr:sterol desaturase family protein [Sphingomicrobium lutaoense]MBB3763186.1 sterol desaturase/sphingolipid hydroxylase (fatty acid hydroxylase superfamily) [Sphingomicrobium lutaoense]
MLAAILLSAAAMTLIVALRYFLSSGLFAAWTARRFPDRMAGQARQVVMEIRYSLYSAAIYGVPAGIVAWGWREHGWTRIYMEWDAYPLWWLPLSFLLMLLAHDAWFYWTHRAMHWPPLFKRIHAVHHASRPPTAWAAMSFHPYEAVTGAIVVPLLVFVIPVHVAVLGLTLLVMTVMGVTNHMGWEVFPRRLVHGPLGKWLITASHHELHHQKYRCNYGLYFRLWDRLCGTDRGLGEFATSAASRASRDSALGSGASPATLQRGADRDAGRAA